MSGQDDWKQSRKTGLHVGEPGNACMLDPSLVPYPVHLAVARRRQVVLAWYNSVLFDKNLLHSFETVRHVYRSDIPDVQAIARPEMLSKEDVSRLLLKNESPSTVVGVPSESHSTHSAPDWYCITEAKLVIMNCDMKVRDSGDLYMLTIYEVKPLTSRHNHLIMQLGACLLVKTVSRISRRAHTGCAFIVASADNKTASFIICFADMRGTVSHVC